MVYDLLSKICTFVTRRYKSDEVKKYHRIMKLFMVVYRANDFYTVSLQRIDIPFKKFTKSATFAGLSS